MSAHILKARATGLDAGRICPVQRPAVAFRLLLCAPALVRWPPHRLQLTGCCAAEGRRAHLPIAVVVGAHIFRHEAAALARSECLRRGRIKPSNEQVQQQLCVPCHVPGCVHGSLMARSATSARTLAQCRACTRGKQLASRVESARVQSRPAPPTMRVCITQFGPRDEPPCVCV